MISTGNKSLFSRSLATLLAVTMCSSSFATHEVDADEPSMEIEFEEAKSNKQAEALDSATLYWIVGGVVTAAAAIFGVPKLFKRTATDLPNGQDDGDPQGSPAKVPGTPVPPTVPSTPKTTSTVKGTPGSGTGTNTKGSGGKRIGARELKRLGLSPQQDQ